MSSPHSQAPEFFLKTLRALVETHAKVMGVSDRHIDTLGLTPAQFDVIATLGDTPGMTCKELGEGTLITKGTLTGVLDRLEARGLVRRERGVADNRQIFVSLTEQGVAVFEATFQPHVDYMGAFFDRMPEGQQKALIALLKELQSTFS